MRYLFVNAFVKSVYSFFRNNYFYRASALAFTTLLAIVPLLVVVVFFITFFPIFGTLIALTQNYLLDNFVPSATVAIKNYFIVFIQQATTMPLGSIVFLFITACMLINTIEETLNVLWQTKKRRKSIWAILFYWSVILFTPLIIGSSIFISSTLLNLSWVIELTNLLQLKLIIDYFIPILINTILFSLLYIVVPSVRVQWQYGVIGGFLAAILLNLTRVGFVFYLSQFKSYSIIYGVFASVPIFMVWLYIAWIIIIWGALFTYYLQNDSAPTLSEIA